ncbi:MAG: nucleotidyltransferase domain-containing protein [Coriobacteriia bacterium]|nr:nucleotidyltransferase domain-containing protein [Coriobacteriia bacterium]
MELVKENSAALANLEVTKIMRPVFARYPMIEQVYLFGSHARGEARYDSDIDLSIVLDNSFVFSLLDMAGLTRILENLTGKSVDILDDYQIDRLRKSNPRFINHYNNDRKLIYVKQ